MSIQIAVRLPEELVEFVDSLVASGHARSRASVVERALERELRLRIAERDAVILRSGTGTNTDDGDLDALAAWARPLPAEPITR